MSYLVPSVRLWPLTLPHLTLLPSLGILRPPTECDSLPEDLEVSLCGDTCITTQVSSVTYIRDLVPCTNYTIIIRESGSQEEVWRRRLASPGLPQVIFMGWERLL